MIYAITTNITIVLTTLMKLEPHILLLHLL